MRPEETQSGPKDSNDRLPISKSFDRGRSLCRGVAQLVERRSPKPKVQSSSLCAPATPPKPFLPINLRLGPCFADVASRQ